MADLIGLLMTYNNLPFFKRAYKQAVSVCDELIVVEGCHLKGYPQRSTDGTCDFIDKIKHVDKVRVVQEFEPGDRYDTVQAYLRDQLTKQSPLWKPGNWVVQWDDDIFFMEDELGQIRESMSDQHDTYSFKERVFAFNFNISLVTNEYRPYFYRITEGSYHKPISHFCYADGTRYRDRETRIQKWPYVHYHYRLVKPTERMDLRWRLSANKGNRESLDRMATWRDVNFNDTLMENMDKFKHLIVDDGVISHYDGPHPEVLDDHPWRKITDIRSARL